MKQIRLSLAGAVLMLVFSMPALAGDIYGGYVQPPPQPQQTTSTGDMYGGYVQPPPATVAGDMETGVAGDMETTLTANEATTTDSLKGMALNVVQSVLSLF